MPKRTRTHAETLPPQSAAEINSEAEELRKAIAAKRKALRELAALNEAENDAAPEDDEPAEGFPGAALIDKIVADIGGQGSFQIFRHVDGKQVQIGSYDITADWENLVSEIVKTKGGGLYSFKFRRADGTLADGFSRTYDPISAPSVAPSNGGGTLETVMAAMLRSSEDRANRAEIDARESREAAARRNDAHNAAMLDLFRARNEGGFLKEIAPLLPVIVPLLKGLFEKRNPLEDIGDVLDIIDSLKEKTVEPSGTWDKIGSVLAQAIAPATAAAMGAALGGRARKTEAPKGIPTGVEVPPAVATPVETVAAPAAAVVPPVAAAEPKENVMSLLDHVESFLTAINDGQTGPQAAEKLFMTSKDKGQDAFVVMLFDNGDWDGLKSEPRLVAHAEWLYQFHSRLGALIEESENAVGV